mgnify:CR=1 FL=1
MNEDVLPIYKNDQVKFLLRRGKGIVTRTIEDTDSSYVDCGKTSSGSGWYYNGVLCLTDEITKKIRKKELNAETPSDDENNRSFQKQCLNEVSEGDVLRTSDDKTVIVSNVSSRQVCAGPYKFVKSDGSGWGSQDVDAMVSSQEQTEIVPHHQADVGDYVKLSNGDIVNVTNVSSRQIRAGGHKFKRSDGTGWADESLSIQ